MENNLLNVRMLGTVSYSEALDLQHELLRQRQESTIPDTLLLLEHPPVLTLGRSSDTKDILLPREALERRGVEVVEIERGGEVTYHGPGQIVGYIFMHVDRVRGDLGRLITNIEEIFIELLKDEYGIAAGRDPEHRGVWIGNRKITAVGIAIRKRVTFHGFAFNVNTDLNHFSWIIPCGIRGKGVTSLHSEIGKKSDINSVMIRTAEYFKSVFGYTEMKIQEECLQIDET